MKKLRIAITLLLFLSNVSKRYQIRKNNPIALDFAHEKKKPPCTMKKVERVHNLNSIKHTLIKTVNDEEVFPTIFSPGLAEAFSFANTIECFVKENVLRRGLKSSVYLERRLERLLTTQIVQQLSKA